MKTLKKFDFPAVSARGSHSIHPWEKWLDGGIYQITHPEDFQSKPEIFVLSIKEGARKHYKNLKIHREEGTITFQASDMDSDQRVVEDTRREKAKATAAANKAKKAAESNGTVNEPQVG